MSQTALSLGLRASRNSLEEELTTFAQPADYTHSRWALTPSVALAYKAGADSIVYVRYGSAFRQGGISADASGNPCRSMEMNSQPSKAVGDNVSAGIDQPGNLPFVVEQHPVRSLIAGGIIETINAGTGAISGAEMSIKLNRHGWSVAAGTSLQSALLVRNETGLLLDDRRLPVVPNWTSRLDIARKFSYGEWDLSADFRLNYMGPARLSFDPALDRPMGNTLAAAASISATRGAFGLSINLDNVLGARGDRFAYGNPLRIFTMQQYVPQAPATFRLTLSYRQ